MKKGKWKTGTAVLIFGLLCGMAGCSGKAKPGNDFEGYTGFSNNTSGTAEGTKTAGTDADSLAYSDAGTAEDGEAETVYEEPDTGEESRTHSFKRVSDQVTAKKDLNVWDHPSAMGKALGIVRANGVIERTGIGDQGWDRVKFEGKTGYVKASLVDGGTEASGQTETANAAEKETASGAEVDTSGFEIRNETVYAAGDVYVRKGPGMAYEPAGVLKKGSSVTRTGKGGQGWDQVSYNGQTGYVYAQYLTAERPTQSQDTPAVTTSDANGQTVYAICPVHVHPENSGNSRSLGVLDTGEGVTQISIGNDGWALVLYKGQEGYVDHHYLTPVKP